MNLTEYQQHLDKLKFGKQLPGAIYIFRDPESDLGSDLSRLISRVEAVFSIGQEFNVLKFRKNELKVSFLSYPSFMDEAHPALRYAITIDLTTGKDRRTDYDLNPNPPILHRKETFLPHEHPQRATFAALTRQEEQVGLFDHTATIGFKLNWERLLLEKGIAIKGNQIIQIESEKSDVKDDRRCHSKQKDLGVTVDRHKTALTRYELSKPVKTIIEYGILKPDATFFDYGCGKGSDIRGLQGLGYSAAGWDPVHRPAEPKIISDIINLGFVLNVIEDPAERLAALVDAFRYARRLLVVSSLISETVDTSRARKFNDGVLTRANTFQKYFDQQELQQYIEDALDSTAVPVALGVFYVFREPTDHQDFIASRTRRSFDWNLVSERLGLGGPRTLWKTLYEEYKDLLTPFGQVSLSLGRMPDVNECEGIPELINRLGSTKRALRVYVEGGGVPGVEWEQIRAKFGVGIPKKRHWEILYEQHQELLDSFWNIILQLGRLPETHEFPRTDELVQKVSSSRQGLRLFIQKGGAEELKRAAENRKRDLLVYVALANLRKRVPFGHLSPSLRADIKEFFGNYTVALNKGLELLFAAGDSGEIELACESLQIGWQDEQALYLHRSLVNDLPPILRAYIGCATALFGDVAQADIVKLHKSSGKASFLVYDDFERNPFPELRQRIKVNLRTRWVNVFDHSDDGQLLYFKERLLSSTHPQRSQMETFSAKIRKLGVPELVMVGPTKEELKKMREKVGLNENLNKKR